MSRVPTFVEGVPFALQPESIRQWLLGWQIGHGYVLFGQRTIYFL